MIKSWYYILLPLFVSFNINATEEKAAAGVGLSGMKSTAVSSPALSTGSYVQMILGLVFVVLLIFALAWLVRRMGRLQSVIGGNMRLLGGLSLGQRERALLVQIGETQMLLGVAPGSVRTLHVFDEPVITAANISKSESFADKLNMILKQKAGA